MDVRYVHRVEASANLRALTPSSVEREEQRAVVAPDHVFGSDFGGPRPLRRVPDSKEQEPRERRIGELGRGDVRPAIRSCGDSLRRWADKARRAPGTYSDDPAESRRVVDRRVKEHELRLIENAILDRLDREQDGDRAQCTNDKRAIGDEGSRAVSMSLGALSACTSHQTAAIASKRSPRGRTLGTASRGSNGGSNRGERWRSDRPVIRRFHA